MRGRNLYIMFILLFFAVMFAIEYHLPKNFVWKPTYQHNDKQPFGCAVFDSILSVSLPNGYSRTNLTFYQLLKKKSPQKRGFLLIGSNKLSNYDSKWLLSLAAAGNKVMLVSNTFPDCLTDTLDINENSQDYYPDFNVKAVRDLYLNHSRDSIYWMGGKRQYPPQYFFWVPTLCDNSYTLRDSLNTVDNVLAVLSEGNHGRKLEVSDTLHGKVNRSHDSVSRWNVCASVHRFGKGKIILCATPLAFTNYGILDHHNARYLFRLLNEMKELPIVRIETYNEKETNVESSPLRVLLKVPPLRWALYLAVLTLLLFMFFTAKRRQRVIPVIDEPKNKSLEFAKLIGTLYYQKKDYTDLFRKKFQYFAEELRRNIRVDITDSEEDEYLSKTIAQKTGIEAKKIRAFLQDIRPALKEGELISEEKMKDFIDRMNQILKQI